MLSPISIFIYWLMENSRPYGKSPEAIHRGLPNRKEKRETEKVKLELPVQNGEELLTSHLLRLQPKELQLLPLGRRH